MMLRIACVLLLAALSCGCSGGPEAPGGMLVELLRFPDDALITDPQPEFSWIVNDVRRGAVQRAYRIVVSSSEDDVRREVGDVWDSGRVDSDRSVAVSYDGEPLEAGRSYWWRVQTWDAEGKVSPMSEAQRFLTGSFETDGAPFPGASAWERLENGRWVLQNRQRASYTPIPPERIAAHGPGHVFADFGRAAFATLEVDLSSEAGGDTVLVLLGERKTDDDRVHTEPGVSNIGFEVDTVVTRPGRHTYLLDLPRHVAHYPNSQVLPDHLPEVAPFRYVELTGAPGDVQADDLRQLALFYPFDETASSFESSDERLDRVWDLCRYTLKATPFLALYADGNRERMPYEADAYIQQLGHYSVDREYAVARYTNQFLLYNPSWPTEWHLHSVLAAWADYMYTGDSEFLEANYDLLQRKTLSDLAGETGLISTGTGLATPEYLATLNYSGSSFRDIVDWPHGTAAGERQARNASPIPGGETDGFVFTDVNAVVNAFHFRALVLTSEIARALGREGDAAGFDERAARVYAAFNEHLFDPERGVYVDGIGTAHASLHANMFPLAFGLVPEIHVERVAAFVKSRGMASSVYGAQYLLEALYAAKEARYALDLMTSEDRRSWLNMLRAGSTMTTEAWDEYYKPNLTWNHAWGSAPANIIARKLMGVEPAEPGYRTVRIRPQPDALDRAAIRVPTIRGTIDVGWTVDIDGFVLSVTIPANVAAEIWLPATEETIREADASLAQRDEFGVETRSDGWTVVRTGSGSYRFSGRQATR